MFYLTYWLSAENSCLGEGQASSLREHREVGVRRFIYKTNSRYFKAAAALEDDLHIICIWIIYLKKTDKLQPTKGSLSPWPNTNPWIPNVCRASWRKGTLLAPFPERRPIYYSPVKRMRCPLNISSAFLSEMCPLTLLLTQKCRLTFSIRAAAATNQVSVEPKILFLL